MPIPDGGSIRIPNLDKVQKALKALGATNKEMGAASFKAGDITARAIRGIMTPHARTGKLMRTVKAAKLGTKVVIRAGNNTTVKYARTQNFGSKKRNIPGQWFIQMGIRRTRQYVLDTYIRELQKLMDKYGKRTR